MRTTGFQDSHFNPTKNNSWNRNCAKYIYICICILFFFFFFMRSRTELSCTLFPFLHNGMIGMEILFFQKKTWPVTYYTLSVLQDLCSSHTRIMQFCFILWSQSHFKAGLLIIRYCNKLHGSDYEILNLYQSEKNLTQHFCNVLKD